MFHITCGIQLAGQPSAFEVALSPTVLIYTNTTQQPANDTWSNNISYHISRACKISATFLGYHTLLTGNQTEALHRSVMHQYSESNPTVRLLDPNDGFSTLLLSLKYLFIMQYLRLSQCIEENSSLLERYAM